MIKERRKGLTKLILLGVFAALATGVIIGAQSTISSRVGTIIGSFKTGILINTFGGLIAGFVLVVLLIINGKGFWQIPTTGIVLSMIAGLLGILIITGVAFSIQKTGVAVGVATLILGEMLVSVIADAKGWGGAAPIPVTWPRVIGLVVIAAGIILLMPKNG